jgi:hypothetical protein
VKSPRASRSLISKAIQGLLIATTLGGAALKAEDIEEPQSKYHYGFSAGYGGFTSQLTYYSKGGLALSLFAERDFAQTFKYTTLALHARLAYADLGEKTSDLPNNLIKSSANVQSLMLGVTLKSSRDARPWPLFIKSKYHLFFGTGLINSTLKTNDGLSNQSENLSGFGISFGFGYRFTRRFGVEYSYTRSYGVRHHDEGITLGYFSSALFWRF